MTPKKNPDLEYIKKHYGENFSRLCRRLFPSILEHEGLLSQVISENFHASRCLFDTLKDDYTAFAQIIEYKALEKLSTLNSSNEVESSDSIESPFELMKKAGYTLYECNSHRDTLKFKKYYKANEALCSFEDEERTDTHIVFFAVKDNLHEIKRSSKPDRQDEYGTSVISIQFSKNPPHTISIKNRYNHTVENPDATFSNNLENIYPGLTESFKSYCDIDFTYSLPTHMLGFVKADDGKFYKYNIFINNVYCCPDNIIIHQGKVIQYEKEKYELVDHFLINKQDCTIQDLSQSDSFIRTTGKIDKIDIVKHVDQENKNRVTKEINLTTKRGIATIVVDSANQMLEYHNPYLKRVDDNFLNSIYNLQIIDLPEVSEIGDNCLQFYNGDTLYFEKVETIGDNFSLSFEGSSINLPKAKAIGSRFCENTYAGIYGNLNYINLPNIQEIGREFLFNYISRDPAWVTDFTINPEMEDLNKLLKAKNNYVKTPLFMETRLEKLRRFQEKFCERNHHANNFQYSSSNPQT